MKLLKKTKVFAIIFYVIAFIYALYTIFSIVTTITYLSSVASSGMYMDVGFSDMLNAFLSTVGPNLFYTCMYFFAGYAIQLISGDIIPADQEFEDHTEKPAVEETIPVETKTEEPAVLTTEENTGYEFQLEQPNDVDEVVATIADIEDETSLAGPEEILELPQENEELLLTEDNVQEVSDEAVKNLEEGFVEEFDLAEPADKEVEALEQENEEDE